MRKASIFETDAYKAVISDGMLSIYRRSAVDKRGLLGVTVPTYDDFPFLNFDDVKGVTEFISFLKSCHEEFTSLGAILARTRNVRNPDGTTPQETLTKDDTVSRT